MRLNDGQLRRIAESVVAEDSYERNKKYYKNNDEPRPAESDVKTVAGPHDIREFNYVMRNQFPNQYGGPAKYEQIWEAYVAWDGHTFKLPVELRSYHMAGGETVSARITGAHENFKKAWAAPEYAERERRDRAVDAVTPDPVAAAKEYIAARTKIKLAAVFDQPPPRQL